MDFQYTNHLPSQVNNPGKNDVLVEVFCTWNKFFLSARAEDKSVAEQNAAKATLNKVIVFACLCVI